MKIYLLLQTTAAIILFSGMAGATLAQPAMQPPEGMIVQRNIPYVENGHANQVLDIYLPEKSSEMQLPLMIWIHGGAWMGGSQAFVPVLYLVEEGYAVASIQHRFSSHAIWPAQAYDCKAAVRFLRAHAAEYNIDPYRIAIGGDSSGGHLAAVIGTSGGVSELEGDLGNAVVSSSVIAVVDWFGPTDLLIMGQQAGPNSMIQHDDASSPESMLVGGPIQERKELAKTADPITYIDSDDPPFLIMHGDNDQLVPLEQSYVLAKALIDAGVEVTMQTIPGAGHEGPEFRNEESRRLILDFLNRHLKNE